MSGGSDMQGGHGINSIRTKGGDSEQQRIGKYLLEAELGRGGMGQVWMAWDPDGKGRHVAIKIVPADVQRAEEEMARVEETFSKIHQLHHQHICPVYTLERDPVHGSFLVMQYVEGQPLSAYRRSYVARHGDFPLEQVVKVLAPVAEALDYAHKCKVVHRDIKPRNILVVGEAEDVQVIDFGLAAQIHTSMSRVSRDRSSGSGTAPYMAPEQWRLAAQDGKTDQYALGVVAFELLAGQLPFESTDEAVLRLGVLNEPVPPVPDQPEHVDRAIARAMAKTREERFATCREFIEALTSPLPHRGEGPGVRGQDAPPPENPSPPTPLPASGARGEDVRIGPKPVPAADPVLPCPHCKKLLRLEPKLAGIAVVCPGCQARLQVSADWKQLTPLGAEKERPSPPRLVTNSIGMKLVLISPGEFLMGSPDSDKMAHSDERPQHQVRITKPFYLGVCPVTQAEYQRVMKGNPSHFKGDAKRPVESVSCEDAQEFCRKLSAIPAESGAVYRLPTEAQWEYACRAGTSTRWCFGDDENRLGDFAWFDKNSGGQTHPVGQKKPNAWGLYDMHGNVWEWCEDWYDGYGKPAVDDPTGRSTGANRVRRGGGWGSGAGFCRSADRSLIELARRRSALGFRVSRMADG